MSAALFLHKNRSRSDVWQVLDLAGMRIATLLLDHAGQVSEVLLHSHGEQERVAALRLALSHTVQFIVDRRVGGKMMLAAEAVAGPTLDGVESSDAAMSFDRIPDGVRAMGEGDIRGMLQGFGVEAVDAQLENEIVVLDRVRYALQYSRTNRTVLCGITHGSELRGIETKTNDWFVAFHLKGAGAPFRFWRVPPEQRGSHLEIDTTTGAVKGFSSIVAVYPPNEEPLATTSNARRAHPTKLFGSWRDLPNGGIVRGNALMVRIRESRMCTQVACEELLHLLSYALLEDNNYVSVG